MGVVMLPELGLVDEKFAITVFGPFITIEDGLAEPERSPDHFKKL